MEGLDASLDGDNVRSVKSKTKNKLGRTSRSGSMSACQPDSIDDTNLSSNINTNGPSVKNPTNPIDCRAASRHNPDDDDYSLSAILASLPPLVDIPDPLPTTMYSLYQFTMPNSSNSSNPSDTDPSRAAAFNGNTTAKPLLLHSRTFSPISTNPRHSLSTADPSGVAFTSAKPVLFRSRTFSSSTSPNNPPQPAFTNANPVFYKRTISPSQDHLNQDDDIPNGHPQPITYSATFLPGNNNSPIISDPKDEPANCSLYPLVTTHRGLHHRANTSDAMPSNARSTTKASTPAKVTPLKPTQFSSSRKAWTRRTLLILIGLVFVIAVTYSILWFIRFKSSRITIITSNHHYYHQGAEVKKE